MTRVPNAVQIGTTKGELSARLTSGATSFSFKTGGGAAFPTAGFVVQIDQEILLVGSRSGDACSSVTRGYAGTAAGPHSAYTDVVLVTAGTKIATGTLPPGGTTGQVPVKQSNADGDIAWQDALPGIEVIELVYTAEELAAAWDNSINSALIEAPSLAGKMFLLIWIPEEPTLADPSFPTSQWNIDFGPYFYDTGADSATVQANAESPGNAMWIGWAGGTAGGWSQGSRSLTYWLGMAGGASQNAPFGIDVCLPGQSVYFSVTASNGAQAPVSGEIKIRVLVI